MARGEDTGNHPGRKVHRDRDYSVGPGGFRGREWNDYAGPVKSVSENYPGLTPQHAASLDETGVNTFRASGKEHTPDRIYVPGGHIKRGGERG